MTDHEEQWVCKDNTHHSQAVPEGPNHQGQQTYILDNRLKYYEQQNELKIIVITVLKMYTIPKADNATV